MDISSHTTRIESSHEAAFPQLKPEHYKKTSEIDPAYNCTAFALGDDSTQAWIDPTPGRHRTWPESVPRQSDMLTYIKLYEFYGFTVCADSSLEQGFEKIALYSDQWNSFTHAARQREDGRWVSKLGAWEDIEHASLECLAGESYGTAARYLKRPRS